MIVLIDRRVYHEESRTEVKIEKDDEKVVEEKEREAHKDDQSQAF